VEEVAGPPGRSMPFGKKKGAPDGAPAPSSADEQRSEVIENLRAILQGAGINPDDYKDESELRAASRKVTSLLERQFDSDCVRFALQSSRQRLQAREAVDAWTGATREERIEVHTRVREAASRAPAAPSPHPDADSAGIC
jgi:hypothetical protein